jgi:hypothetical protein
LSPVTFRATVEIFEPASTQKILVIFFITLTQTSLKTSLLSVSVFYSCVLIGWCRTVFTASSGCFFLLNSDFQPSCHNITIVRYYDIIKLSV